LADPTTQRQSLADRQLSDARRDPRLEHGRDAVVVDWWAAMGASERVRTLADWGLQELLDSEIHEVRRLEAEGCTPDDARWRPVVEAARQRAELARAERDNQLVEHNAMTLVSMVGALDALVEALVPRAREIWIHQQAQTLLECALEQEPEAAGKIDDVTLEKVLQATTKTTSQLLPSIDPSPKGAGAKRWEDVLRHAGLQAPPDRPVPEDLDQALAEVVALRHVLTHRAGRVDLRALKQVPSLSYADGELVRVTHDDYLLYSAALWAYGEEIIGRLLGSLARVRPPLTEWRQNYTLNA
jgi:hypothetical protein